MGLNEKLLEILGDEELTKKVSSSLGEFMLPKTEYAKVRDALKAKEDELESIRLSSMDSEQKLQHELSKTKAIQDDFNKKSNRLEAEKLFVTAGLTSDVYEGLLEKAVSEDKDRTLSLVGGFVEILSKEKENVANKTKEDLINQTKKPAGGEEVTPPKPKPVKTTF